MDGLFIARRDRILQSSLTSPGKKETMTGQTQSKAPFAGDRVVLVTGAGSGIGRAAALRFARAGARVALAGRRHAPLDAVAGEIRAAGGIAEIFTADLADPAAAARLPQDVVARLGRLDAAFNNAGVSAYAPMAQLTVDDFDRVMGTNVRAVWLLVKEEVAAMRAAGRGGAIVNTSSIAATGGTAGLSIYSASKGALDSMIRAIALEIGGDGIRINNVSPGVIRTPLTSELPDEAFSAFGAHAALKRVGEPEDIADVAVWLCSEEARFVTGQSIVADGGFNIAGAR
jgi:NAD(P)-dependent dehydrogenase (short-subunit alcohol dehydrogenase family)